MFALPVNINQFFAQGAEKLQRGVAAIDTTSVAPVAAKFAGQDHLIRRFRWLNPFPVKHGLDVGNQGLRSLEHAFDDGFVRASPNKIGVGASAKQQIYRVNYDRFASTSFTRDDIEAGFK